MLDITRSGSGLSLASQGPVVALTLMSIRMPSPDYTRPGPVEVRLHEHGRSRQQSYTVCRPHCREARVRRPRQTVSRATRPLAGARSPFDLNRLDRPGEPPELFRSARLGLSYSSVGARKESFTSVGGTWPAASSAGTEPLRQCGVADGGVGFLVAITTLLLLRAACARP